MFKSENKKNARPDPRQLAGMIARMPTADPPADLTDAVMRRIQPKRVPPRQNLIRRIRIGWAMLPMQALAAGAVVALIFGAVLTIQGYRSNGQGAQTAQIAAVATEHKIQVSFRLDWPAAHQVALIGSFNQWDPDGYPMHRDATGEKWIIDLKLPQGKYTYAFLIDGQRVVADPHSLWQQDDGFGNVNSSIIVENGEQHANTI